MFRSEEVVQSYQIDLRENASYTKKQVDLKLPCTCKTNPDVFVSPFQGEKIFFGDAFPGRRGVPLALGYHVSALQAEEALATQYLQ